MIDKDKIHEDLIKAFINYQYRLDNPMPSPEETPEKIISSYQNDPIFNRKVNGLVSGVMHILESHL